MKNPKTRLQGFMKVPGDKSISHRSLLFSSLSGFAQNGNSQPSRISGLLEGADVLATWNCLNQLGIEIQKQPSGELWVTGVSKFQEPSNILDAQNSGTTMRLMTGLLAPQKIYCVLTGDQSLRKRPMSRVINPIRQMGGIIQGRQQDTLSPLTILPSPKELQGIEYTPPHASAQVKSCVLLAGLFSKGTTTVIEPIPTRDHTERMFQYMGIPLSIITRPTLEKQISLEEGAISAIQSQDWVIPGDFSSAAFFMVAALLIPGSEICIQQVNMNPSRIGLLKVLLKMRAKIQIENQAFLCGEPVADLVVQSSHLKGDILVTPEEVPDLIDEIPILAIAALFLEGSLTIQGAEDLRKKESDRINALFQNFEQLGLHQIGQKIGITLEEFPDGMKIHGSPDLALHPGLASGPPLDEHLKTDSSLIGLKTFNTSKLLASFHDHRIVMSFLILKHICQANQPNQPLAWDIDGMDWINTSFPGFMNQLKQLMQ